MDTAPNPRKPQGPNASEGADAPRKASPVSTRSSTIQTGCNGNDAVCFTAGFAGSMFGAGAIHAYLAADRKPPALVAGISMGAVNAAAMQRCYQELAKVSSDRLPEREVARWTWFREYLSALTDEPLAALWRGLPRQTDLAADLPPIRDTSLEEFTDKESKEFLKNEEKRARRELYLFMRLGQWLAGLPLKLSEVADFLVTYVRVKEKVPGKRWRSKLKLVTYSPARLFVSVIWQLCFRPTWIYESRFGTAGTPNAKQLPWVRPLFGWSTFLAAWALFLPMVAVAGLLAGPLFFGLWTLLSDSQVAALLRQFKDLTGSVFSIVLVFLGVWVLRAALLVPAMVLCGLTAAIYGLWQFAARWMRKKGQPKKYPLTNAMFRWLSGQLFGGIELKRSLIHNFHLRLRLTRLFGNKGKSDTLTELPMPAVLVAAPLQGLEEVDGKRRGVSQVWARSGVPIVEALLAALALPGIFPPQRLIRTKKKNYPQDLRFWEVKPGIRVLDIVDGSVVRENPLPAIFRFIKRPGREALAKRLYRIPTNPGSTLSFPCLTANRQRRPMWVPSGSTFWMSCPPVCG